MHAFDVLGDPVRRRILELLSEGERSAGQVTEVAAAEFGISQPTVSGHLRVLRENGFATVRREGTRRLYAVEPAPLQEVDQWLEGFRRFWSGPLDALATELARGNRRDRQPSRSSHPDSSNEGDRQ
ncbi:ArsR/SmtB family transcription factor [Rhodococcus tibetensis]|uniref:Metalloregulator ArsR/SmtB family transcription factor n=1 Tax=Rhodococcus tibetensis TaxID=2965064 RepID=A0ABT1QB49_9NOCA|nr:metalloregulator ArsR/SmtB family transcription factor [Rhodococcus sp. FXJ9.536]MCQ4119493.1 metalloregulator ArsR/SmtB family transcription factor [Rhodococcus sp. FXJ9.536]